VSQVLRAGRPDGIEQRMSAESREDSQHEHHRDLSEAAVSHSARRRHPPRELTECAGRNAGENRLRVGAARRANANLPPALRHGNDIIE
jgi:hypothetical protein